MFFVKYRLSLQYTSICGLICGVSNAYYAVSNDETINEQWIGKDMERKGRGLVGGPAPASD
jgi:hypothetical protein